MSAPGAHFTRVPEWATESGGLPDELGAYQQLAKRMKTPRPVEGETPAQRTLRMRRERTVFFTRPQLVENLGVGPQQADRLIRAVEALGIAEVKRSKGKANAYYLPELPPTGWQGPRDSNEAEEWRRNDRTRKQGDDVSAQGGSWKAWRDAQRAKVAEVERPYTEAAKERLVKHRTKKAAAVADQYVATDYLDGGEEGNQSVGTDYYPSVPTDHHQYVATDPNQTGSQTVVPDEVRGGLLSPPKAEVVDAHASERPSAGANNEPTLSRETAQILADPSVRALGAQHLSPAQLAMADQLITQELAVLGRDGVERVSWRLVQGLAGESVGSIREPFGWLQTYVERLGCARGCVCKRPDCERGVIWGDGTPCRDCQREAEDRMAAAATAGASAPEPESPPVPEQRPAAPVLPWQDCDGCDRTFRASEPGLCRDCQTQSQYAIT